jgi:hemerythrin superfamily protein
MLENQKYTPLKKGSTTKDAVALLKADHKEASKLFADFEATKSLPKKKAIAAEICNSLKIHAQTEEKIFYPAVKAALKDKEHVPESEVVKA